MFMSRAGGVARLPPCRSSSMRRPLRTWTSGATHTRRSDMLPMRRKLPEKASMPALPLPLRGRRTRLGLPYHEKRALPATHALPLDPSRGAEPRQQQQIVYNFPVERALRHLRRGRHHRRQCDGDCASVRRLLVETAEVRRFTNYHCHHVLVHFKRDRVRWNALQRRCGFGGGGSTPSPSPLNATELAKVVHYLFSAAVLLHLTGLYHVSATYVGRLAEVVFSGTVFLSMAYSPTRTDSTDADRRDAADAEYDMHQLCHTPPTLASHWHSLHWATVHYCEGVSLWRLLREGERRDLLLPEQVKVRKPRLRLMGLLAALVLRVAPDDVTHAERHSIAYLCRAVRGALTSATSLPCRTARRAMCAVDGALLTCHLQLLPLLWLAMLLDHVLRTAGTTADEQARHDVTYRTVRHAMLRLLPLFAGATHDAELLWLLLRRLYAPTCAMTLPAMSTTHCVATAIELSAVLSVMEQHNVRLPVSHSSRALHATDVLTWWLHERDVAMPPYAIDQPRIKHHHEVYSAVMRIPSCAIMTAALSRRATGNGDATPCTNLASDHGADGLRFATRLVLQLLLQWCSPTGAAYRRLPPRDDISTHDGRRCELAVNYLVEELAHALMAAHHVEQLLSQLQGSMQPVRQVSQPALDARDSLASALQAIMRCLTWQLGHVVLPQRIRLAREHGMPLGDEERRVLRELNNTARTVLLLLRRPTGSTQAGAMPDCFTTQIQALLCVDSEQRGRPRPDA